MIILFTGMEQLPGILAERHRATEESVSVLGCFTSVAAQHNGSRMTKFLIDVQCNAQLPTVIGGTPCNIGMLGLINLGDDSTCFACNNS